MEQMRPYTNEMDTSDTGAQPSMDSETTSDVPGQQTIRFEGEESFHLLTKASSLAERMYADLGGEKELLPGFQIVVGIRSQVVTDLSKKKKFTAFSRIKSGDRLDV